MELYEVTLERTREKDIDNGNNEEEDEMIDADDFVGDNVEGEDRCAASVMCLLLVAADVDGR